MRTNLRLEPMYWSTERMKVKVPSTTQLIILAFCVNAMNSTVGESVMQVKTSQKVESDTKAPKLHSGRYISTEARMNPVCNVGRMTDKTGIPKNHQSAKIKRAVVNPEVDVRTMRIVSLLSMYRLTRTNPTREPK